MKISRIPGQKRTMRTDGQYMNWTVPEKIDKLCGILMPLGAKERKGAEQIGGSADTTRPGLAF
eukprot:14249888-Heterocapsa_arctica.AAC.1